MIGGIAVVNDDELGERLTFLQNAVGAISGPFDSFLALRGLKTLHLRMERHCTNAQQLAEWLEGHAHVEQVMYPGLASHPQHELARRQMSAFGGMIAVRLKGDLDFAREVLERCRVFALAESLGGVESLIEHPAIMTHASVPPKQRLEIGITDTLIRLSVGVEDIIDLKEDLDQALAGASKSGQFLDDLAVLVLGKRPYRFTGDASLRKNRQHGFGSSCVIGRFMDNRHVEPSRRHIEILEFHTHGLECLPGCIEPGRALFDILGALRRPSAVRDVSGHQLPQPRSLHPDIRANKAPP
jgi:hypothetical protein